MKSHFQSFLQHNDISSSFLFRDQLVDDQMQVAIRDLVKRMVRYKGEIYNNDRATYEKVREKFYDLGNLNRRVDGYRETHDKNGKAIGFSKRSLMNKLELIEKICNDLMDELEGEHVKQFQSFKDEAGMLLVTLKMTDYNSGYGRD